MLPSPYPFCSEYPEFDVTTASVPKFERDLTTEYTKSIQEIQSSQNDTIWEEKLEALMDKKPTIFSYLCAFQDHKFIKKILSFANDESKTKGFQIAVGVGNVKLLELLKDFKPNTEIMKNYLHFAMVQNKGSVINSNKKLGSLWGGEGIHVRFFGHNLQELSSFLHADKKAYCTQDIKN